MRPIDWVVLVLAFVVWGLATGSPLMRADTEPRPAVRPNAPHAVEEAHTEPQQAPSAMNKDTPADTSETARLAGDP